MGKRGPKPKAAFLEIFEGNPSKRPVHAVPQPIGACEPPEHLDLTDDMKKEWARVVSSMPNGLFTSADQALLLVYVTAWHNFTECLKTVSSHGRIIIGSAGQKAKHPLIDVAIQERKLLLQAIDRMGLSPSARARLNAPEEDQLGDLEGLIGTRGALSGSLSLLKH